MRFIAGGPWAAPTKPRLASYLFVGAAYRRSANRTYEQIISAPQYNLAMRTILSAAIAVVLGVMFVYPALAYSPAELDPQTPLFTQALAQCGLGLDDLAVDQADRALWGGDKYRLPYFDVLMGEPLKISPFVQRQTDMLVANSNNIATTLIAAQSRLNQGVRLGLTGDVLEPYKKRVEELGPDCLAVALMELDKYAGKSEAKKEDYIDANYGKVDPLLRDNAALLLFVMPDTLEYRRLGLTEPINALGLDPQEVYETVLKSTLANEQDDEVEGAMETTLLIEKLLDHVDFPLLNTGATLLALAVQKVCDAMQPSIEKLSTSPAAPYFSIETQLGWVRIGDMTNRFFTQDPVLLQLSSNLPLYPTMASKTASYANAISVAISLFGDAQTGSGAGIFGYGLYASLDRAASRYGSIQSDAAALESGAQGFGLFGTGILYDAGGDDTYSGLAACQGCGIYGTGLLIDGGGNDRYECYQQGQGFGFTGGVGLLLDVTGNDTYIANDTDIKYPSAQSKEHNGSLSQGFGFGRRGDYLDGHSWAGGVGLLVDGAGDDAYSCGIFGQGGAYWYGVGILADKGGDDSYLGQWYCQGSAAHFALGILQDTAGNDKYSSKMNMCGGAGHDFSLGWLEDRAGNDAYDMPNLSLGGGNANGVGVFCDVAGDDNYLSSGVTLGQGGVAGSGSVRDFIMTLGVFVDGGGADMYMERQPEGAAPKPFAFCGDGMAWMRPGASAPPVPGEHGCGVDAGS